MGYNHIDDITTTIVDCQEIPISISMWRKHRDNNQVFQYVSYVTQHAFRNEREILEYKTRNELKAHKILFVYNHIISCTIIWKMCT